MLKKMKVIKTISQLPDEFSIDELVDHVKMLEQKQKDPAPLHQKRVLSNDGAYKAATHWFG